VRRTGASLPWLAPLAAGLLFTACSAERLEVITLFPNSLQLGMLAHWSCDEGVGARIADRSGNGHDGALFGPTFIEGRFDRALHFDSGDSAIVEDFPQASSSFSVALWYRAPAGDFGDAVLTLLGNEQPSLGGWAMEVQLGTAGNRFRFGYPSGGGVTQVRGEGLVAGRWVHLAAVVDAEDRLLSLLADGQVVASNTIDGTIAAGTASLWLGRSPDARRALVGDLDDIVLFNRALVPEEVQVLSRRPAPDPR
jgi:hypothetical protein